MSERKDKKPRDSGIVSHSDKPLSDDEESFTSAINTTLVPGSNDSSCSNDTVDGRDTGQNAITWDTCCADT